MREFSLIKKNILQYLEYQGVSKYKFYKETGITNGILSQNTGLSEENTLRVLNYYKDISAEWLLRGEGSMLKNEGKSAEESNEKSVISLPEDAGIAYFDRLMDNLDNKERENKELYAKIVLLEEKNRQLQAENKRLRAENEALKTVHLNTDKNTDGEPPVAAV